MPDATDRRFPVKISIVMAVLVALVVTVAFAWRPVLIAYHNHGLAVSAADGADPRGGQSDDATLRFRRHLRPLVDLGHFEIREFELRNIRLTRRCDWGFDLSEQYMLELLLVREVPGIAYFDFFDGPGLPSLEIVARPEVIARVEEFVAAHDVADFTERFSEDAEEARQELLRRSRPDP